MKELLRSNDAVFLSWVEAVLADAGIECLVLDFHASLVDGSIGAVARRIMVAQEDYFRATRIIENERPDAEGAADAGGV